MLEKIASSWMIGLYSFLEISQFTPKVPNLWDKETFNVEPINGTRIKRSDVLLGYLIMFWVVLYFMYEKCLNVSFNILFYTSTRYRVSVSINEFVRYFFLLFFGHLFAKSADKG